MFVIGMGQRRPRGTWVFVFVTLCWLAACAREVERPGQLMVAIDTDMALPDQLDSLTISLTVAGIVVSNHTFDSATGDLKLPATKGFATRDEAPLPVTLRVSASKLTEKKGFEWRTFREAVTTIPSDRVVTLRMPLQWLCKGMAEAVPVDPNSLSSQKTARSSCGAGQTCRAGRCESSVVDAARLPLYEPSEIFGGGETAAAGRCFDTAYCLQDAATVQPDDACTIAKPEGNRINVALQVDNDGICDDSGSACFVPLDGRDREGWTISGDRIALPAAVCSKLEDGSVRAVRVSDTCETKTAGVPACGPWSSVTKAKATAGTR